MRCVPDHFKPLVSPVASALAQAFNTHHHSSYLYTAEILANTYASDQEVVPILKQLFHELSGAGMQCFVAAIGGDRLDDMTELVEDFFGMFERYLRFAPSIVLEAETLQPTLNLWVHVIFVQQKDAIEAVIAFIEAVMGIISEVKFCTGQAMTAFEANRFSNSQRESLRLQVAQVAPFFVEAFFKLIAGVPTLYVQETLPGVLECIRDAFRNEFVGWLKAGFQHLPESVVSPTERENFVEQLVKGDRNTVIDVLQDLCYRSEQVYHRNRTTSGKSQK